MIIADTSVWIPFFNRPDSHEKSTLDLLIDGRRLVLVGIVLAELLQGCRTSKERAQLQEALLALPYVEVHQSTWIKAGEVSSGLLRKGLTLPMSDLLIAALAMERGFQIYSLDTHFQKIPGVSRYAP